MLSITPMTTKPPKTACRKKRLDDAQPCSITMPKILQEAVVRRAQAEDRSFSATVRRAVESYLERAAS
jgi:hypothetical protein